MNRLLPLSVIALAVIITIASPTFAQNSETKANSNVGTITETNKAPETPSLITAVRSGRSPALSELLRIDAAKTAKGEKPVISDGEINPHVIPDSIRINGALDNNAPPPERGVNPVSSTRAPSALLSIEGYSNDDNAALLGGRIAPPDTNGDVGRNHYVMYVNLGWVFFNKTNGSVAGGPFPGNIFWQGFGGVCETQNAGDPIVLYDHLAGRWLFSQFTGTAIADGHQCVAISDGENPAGPYTLYDFIVSPSAFNDYPKISVWPDGYYMTTHEFVGAPFFTFAGVNLTVFDRASMLAGNPNAGFIQFTTTTSGDELEFGALAGHLEGPATPPNGSCNYVVHASDVETFGLPGADRYRFWEACVNFNNPAASTLNQINSVGVPAFDKNLCGFNRNCIIQPGTQRLDSLAAMTLYRFSLRYFANEGVLKSITTTNVDVGADRAGVQWIGFDINPTTNATSLSDGGNLLGTIDFNDGESRWMGSATLDQDGNVGIGYTRASASTFPSVYFTVHERGVDAPGAVQQESVCINGTGSQTGTNRWADYASASIDPVDQCTFWIANEYVETTGNFNWNTRVCSFRIPSCGAPAAATFEVGSVNVNQSNSGQWRTINLSQSFSNPVVVMGPPTFNGNQPTTIRVRNVTSSSFEYQMDEWEYLDGGHINETIGYLVVEAGSSTLGSLNIEAGIVSSSSVESFRAYSQSFSGTPVVLTQVATVNEATAVAPRIRNLTANSFAHRIEEEEAIRASGHAVEDLHYIAIAPGSTSAGGRNILVAITGNSVTQDFFTANFSQTISNPVFLAGMQTRDGGDTSALRYQNLTGSSVQFKVEEEQSLDSEVNHTTEVVGYVVISN
ncbi:MAG: hypothetical protein Tsb002_32940 [Wenzhouxiangellaceae bacterium]